jgi:hypothetical protein
VKVPPADPARLDLLFLRVIPGFTPTASSYALAEEVYTTIGRVESSLRPQSGGKTRESERRPLSPAGRTLTQREQGTAIAHLEASVAMNSKLVALVLIVALVVTGIGTGVAVLLGR